MQLLQTLQNIESRRQFRGWEPRKAVSQATGTFSHILVRAIGLRGLEIPVGEWTEQFIETYDLGSDVADILRGHIDDEDNHDLQLSYLAEYMGCQAVPIAADDLVDRWLRLECHPLLKKMVLEAGVFFPILGMMGVYAKSDLLIQNVRQWISSDEAAHVASSRAIIDYLRKNGEQIIVPPGLLELVTDTIKYLCNGADEEKWLRASRSGISTGKIEGGDRLTTVSVQEQFTQKTNSEILYQSRNK
jgi:hypothetical protein